jgi:histidinol phosphatase-like enzyme
MVSIAFLSENNVAHDNKFKETLTLKETELEFEKQKLTLLTRSDGVFYEVFIVQNQNKVYTLDISGNTCNAIKLLMLWIPKEMLVMTFILSKTLVI